MFIQIHCSKFLVCVKPAWQQNPIVPQKDTKQTHTCFPAVTSGSTSSHQTSGRSLTGTVQLTQTKPAIINLMRPCDMSSSSFREKTCGTEHRYSKSGSLTPEDVSLSLLLSGLLERKETERSSVSFEAEVSETSWTQRGREKSTKTGGEDYCHDALWETRSEPYVEVSISLKIRTQHVESLRSDKLVTQTEICGISTLMQPLSFQTKTELLKVNK